jgi:hypothetical protein
VWSSWRDYRSPALLMRLCPWDLVQTAVSHGLSSRATSVDLYLTWLVASRESFTTTTTEKKLRLSSSSRFLVPMEGTQQPHVRPTFVHAYPAVHDHFRGGRGMGRSRLQLLGSAHRADCLNCVPPSPVAQSVYPSVQLRHSTTSWWSVYRVSSRMCMAPHCAHPWIV